MPVIRLLESVGLLDIHTITQDGTIRGSIMEDIILITISGQIIITGIITLVIITGHIRQ